jgi:uncharacterized protein (TIGR02679 family)
MSAPASAYLQQAGLQRALEGARAQVERLGRVGGTIALTELNAKEATALSGLLGGLRRRERPRPGRPFKLTVRDLDAALAGTRFALSLREALELIGPPLDPRPERRERERAAVEEGWAAALTHPLCLREVAARAWVEQLRATGALVRAAGVEAAALLGQALDLGDRLPSERPIDRTRLATEFAGDPHALDENRPLSRLMLRQLAVRAGEPQPRIALDRRALWQRFGVLSDAASADVLTLGLRPFPLGPLAEALTLLGGWHVRLTVGQLARERLHFEPGVEVFVCENPTVLTEAEALQGSRCRPLVCTGGWPSSAAWMLLDALVTDGARLRYHGDFDWDGVRMSTLLRSRFGARSWRFDEISYRTGIMRHPERTRPLDGREAEDDEQRDLVAAMCELNRELHEQAVLEELLNDLADGED